MIPELCIIEDCHGVRSGYQGRAGYYCRTHADRFRSRGGWPPILCVGCGAPMLELADLCGFCVAEARIVAA